MKKGGDGHCIIYRYHNIVMLLVRTGIIMLAVMDAPLLMGSKWRNVTVEESVALQTVVIICERRNQR